MAEPRSSRAIRTKACELAAQVMQGAGPAIEGGRLWSLTVFFESYICEGSETTGKYFALSRAKSKKGLRFVAGGKL